MTKVYDVVRRMNARKGPQEYDDTVVHTTTSEREAERLASAWTSNALGTWGNPWYVAVARDPASESITASPNRENSAVDDGGKAKP